MGISEQNGVKPANESGLESGKNNGDLQFFSRNCVDVIGLDMAGEKIKQGEALRLKFGADPSAPDLHLGHAVVLKKLRSLQEMGHRVDFLIGDYTGMIGDPTGKSKTRPTLTKKEVLQNAKTYEKQIFKILDENKTNIVFNSHWHGKQDAAFLIKLMSHVTVAQIIEREDFSNRLKNKTPISMSELLYPLLQAYDSVALESDLEIGGTDQTFNLLLGRELQKSFGQTQQIVMTMPIIEGTDGKEKMSKSLGNFIALTDSPKDMFGKLMSINDEIMWKYFRLLTNLSDEKIDMMRREVADGMNPRDTKLELARLIVSDYHGEEKGQHEKEQFLQTFSRKEAPSNMKSLTVPSAICNALDLVMLSGHTSSKSEARRLLSSGAIKIDNEKIMDAAADIEIVSGSVLKLGKKTFFKLVL